MIYKHKELQHFQRQYLSDRSRLEEQVQNLEDAVESLASYAHFLEMFLCSLHGVDKFDSAFEQYQACIALASFFAFLNDSQKVES